MTKTLYSIEGNLVRLKNKELLKWVLGSTDKNFVLYISYRNLLNRIRNGGKQNDREKNRV